MITAYYAFIDENNYVTEVIPGKEGPIEGLPPEEYYANLQGQRCLRTSLTGLFRGCYAGIGYFYDETKDEFIPPASLPFPFPENIK